LFLYLNQIVKYRKNFCGENYDEKDEKEYKKFENRRDIYENNVEIYT